MLLNDDNTDERLKVGVLGLGTSNLGVLKYLLGRGFRFSLTVRDRGEPRLSSLPGGITPRRIMSHEHCLRDINEDYLFLSPSARWDTPELIAARARGVILSSDVSLFFRQNSRTRVFAVTGTDGKSTTVTMLGELLRAREPSAVCCGNIGSALSPLLLSPPSSVAMELSSFQLMETAPRVESALITNVSENHLDWHKNFSEYVSAKETIFKNARWRATSADDEITLSIATKYGADALFSLSKSDSELCGLGARLRITLRDGHILRNGEKILDRSEIRSFGKCNTLNFMGALAMLEKELCEEELIRAVRGFRPLPHRAEHVGTFGGIDFIDSSIDSTPMRTKATLASLGTRPVVILGGHGKNLSLKPLLDALFEHSSAAVVTGECQREMIEAISSDERLCSVGYKLLPAESLSEAVPLAASLAGKGGSVILSPAATSYDAFTDYKARGKEFLRLAQLLDQ